MINCNCDFQPEYCNICPIGKFLKNHMSFLQFLFDAFNLEIKNE